MHRAFAHHGLAHSLRGARFRIRESSPLFNASTTHSFLPNSNRAASNGHATRGSAADADTGSDDVRPESKPTNQDAKDGVNELAQPDITTTKSQTFRPFQGIATLLSNTDSVPEGSDEKDHTTPDLVTKLGEDEWLPDHEPGVKPVPVRDPRSRRRQRGAVSATLRKARAKELAEAKHMYPSSKRLPRYALSADILERELRYIAQVHPHPVAVQNILSILIERDHVKPRSSHYEAVILSQCHPELGSVDNVKATLQEMEREGMPFDPAILFAVLKVLAVHPDADLRTNATTALEDQWVSIPESLAQLIVVAMIREGQLELARAEINNLTQKGIAIEPWIWPILIHEICDRGDFETVLRLLHDLEDSGYTTPPSTLAYLLEKSSEAGDYQLTRLLWRRYVESMHIPSTQTICLDTMRIAAKNNDLKLAESVAIVLEHLTTSTMTAERTNTTPSAHEKPLDMDTMFGESDNLEEHKDDSHAITRDISTNHPSSPQAPQTQIPIPIHPTTEARTILSDLRRKHNSVRQTREHRRGNLYPLFPNEEGMREARFDPSMALLRPFGWWKARRRDGKSDVK